MDQFEVLAITGFGGIQLSEPLRLRVFLGTDGFLEVNYEPLSILCFARSLPKLKELVEDSLETGWSTFGKEPDVNLTDGAIRVKQNYHQLLGIGYDLS